MLASFPSSVHVDSLCTAFVIHAWKIEHIYYNSTQKCYVCKIFLDSKMHWKRGLHVRKDLAVFKTIKATLSYEDGRLVDSSVQTVN